MLSNAMRERERERGGGRGMIPGKNEDTSLMARTTLGAARLAPQALRGAIIGDYISGVPESAVRQHFDADGI